MISHGRAFALAIAGFEKAHRLRNRTFIGLLMPSFAAFNDQAIHASAMFFAINKKTLTEANAISLMPILFFAPWAIFCHARRLLCGQVQQAIFIVFWKFAEIVITGSRRWGSFSQRNELPNSASGSLSRLFLDGHASTFFVPAKYGDARNSRRRASFQRNGMLESLSFLASSRDGGRRALVILFSRRRYIIGLI